MTIFLCSSWRCSVSSMELGIFRGVSLQRNFLTILGFTTVSRTRREDSERRASVPS